MKRRKSCRQRPPARCLLSIAWQRGAVQDPARRSAEVRPFRRQVTTPCCKRYSTPRPCFRLPCANGRRIGRPAAARTGPRRPRRCRAADDLAVACPGRPLCGREYDRVSRGRELQNKRAAGISRSFGVRQSLQVPGIGAGRPVVPERDDRAILIVILQRALNPGRLRSACCGQTDSGSPAIATFCVARRGSARNKQVGPRHAHRAVRARARAVPNRGI